ncbi:MAG: Ig-like domain-containing protein [Gemmatimonadaceae bacterium]
MTISAASAVLIRGDEAQLTAQAWQRGGGGGGITGDSLELKNVDLRWSSTDTRIATVVSAPGGIGVVTGVNPGIVQIRAVAPGLESGSQAAFVLRVANPLEIDSVGPDTVKYGEKLTMYGVGVGSLFFAGLGDGFLAPDSFSIAGIGDGLSQQSFWVLYPSRTGSIFAAGSGQLIFASDSTVVLPYDLYEPNEASPTLLDLTEPPPFPAIPEIRFFNPGLAFEDIRQQVNADWYRFRTASTSTPYTFVFNAPALAGTNTTFLAEPQPSLGPASPFRWTIGSGFYRCKGFDFTPEEAPSDSVVIALQRLPASGVDLVSIFAQEGRYVLAVIEGYVTARPSIQPDRFEENDICDFADDNYASATTRIDVTSTEFAENLTIDNPHDIDWIRFKVPGPLPIVVTVKAARAGSFPGVDRSDIDLYLLTVPGGSTGLVEKARDVNRGSTSAISRLLNPGDYYLVVADSAGFATHYGLCIVAGSDCTLPPAPAITNPSTTSRVNMPVLAPPSPMPAEKRAAGSAPGKTRRHGRGEGRRVIP